MIRCHGYQPLILIFCIIVLGFAVSRTPVSSVGLGGAGAVDYYLFFPALLISHSQHPVRSGKLLDIGLSLGLALLVFTLLFAGLHRFIAERRDSWARYIRAVSVNTYIDSPVSKRFTGTLG